MDSGKIVGLAVALLLLATLGMNALGSLGNADEYSSVTDESFTTTVWGSAVNLDEINLITSTTTVSYVNGTTILPTSNYTIDLTLGTITPTASGLLTNATEFYIDYRHGAVDTTVATLVKTIVSIVFGIVVIIILLREADIKIKD